MFAVKFHWEGFPSNTADYSHNNPLFNFYFSRCHMLLCSQQEPDYDNDASVMSELLRLSLLLFMISICRVIAPRSSTTTEQMRKLKLVFGRSRVDWTDMQPLRAWIICMGYLEADSSLDNNRWWRNFWKHSLDSFPTTGVHSITPSKLLQDLPREVSWIQEPSMSDGKPQGQRMFLDYLSRAILKVVSSIIWVDAVHGKRYRDLVGKKVPLHGSSN